MTDNEDYAMRAYNMYEDRGYEVQYVNTLDSNIVCLSFKKLTPSYRTGSCVWRQVQEDGILRLMMHMLSCMLPRSIIIAYNTDSFTITCPKPEAIEDAREITKNKDDVDNIGKLKIETTIKVKGLPFELRNEITDPYFVNVVSKKTYKREDYSASKFQVDVNSLTDSRLINAKLAGSGKTWLLVSLFNNETDIILLPTHEALQNVLRTAKDQGVTIDEKNKSTGKLLHRG